jgi:hypothetical protein
MPLITNFANREPEKVVNRSIDQRTWRIGTDQDYLDYREITTRETVQWYGFTEDAARNQVFAGGVYINQPTDGGTYSWSCNETERLCGAYMVERTYERKVTDLVGQSTPPTLGSISISPAQDLNRTNLPTSVSLTSATVGSVIFWKLDSYSGSTLVSGSWTKIESSTGTVSAATNNSAGGSVINNVAYDKYVILSAYSQYTTLGGITTNGPTSVVRYAIQVPALNPVSFSLTNNTVLTFNTNITLTCAGASRIRYWRYYCDTAGNFQLADDSEGRTAGGESVSVSLSPDRLCSYVTGGGGQNHKAAYIVARGEFLVNGSYYNGTAGSRYIWERIPAVYTPTANYSNNSAVTFPVTLTFTTGGGSGMSYYWSIYTTSGWTEKANSEGGGTTRNISLSFSDNTGGATWNGVLVHKLAYASAQGYTDKDGARYWGGFIDRYIYQVAPTVGSYTGLNPASYANEQQWNPTGQSYWTDMQIKPTFSGNVTHWNFRYAYTLSTTDGTGQWSSTGTGSLGVNETINPGIISGTRRVFYVGSFYYVNNQMFRIQYQPVYIFEGVTYVGGSYSALRYYIRSISGTYL